MCVYVYGCIRVYTFRLSGLGLLAGEETSPLRCCLNHDFQDLHDFEDCEFGGIYSLSKDECLPYAKEPWHFNSYQDKRRGFLVGAGSPRPLCDNMRARKPRPYDLFGIPDIQNAVIATAYDLGAVWCERDVGHGVQMTDELM